MAARQLILFAQLLLATALQLTAPRLLIGGLSAPERALVANVVADATGSEWRVEPVASEQRVVLLDGLDVDDDEWLLQTVAEALDNEAATALVTAGTVGDAAPSEALDAARAEHIERYSLRRPVTVKATEWEAGQARVAMHTTLDGATVEHAGASWWDVSEAVVYDGVVDESLRAELLSLLHGEGWDPEAAPDPRWWERGALTDLLEEELEEESSRTGAEAEAEGAGEGAGGAGAGWGVRASALEALCEAEGEAEPPPLVELQSRLLKLVEAANPGKAVALCRQPAVFGDAVAPLAANAPVAADGEHAYGWHIDADPVLLPPSPWTDAYGRKPNRMPGAPRFVSALVYLSPRWADAWGAPTRLLDPPTSEVVRVPPAPGRLLLMDQDITHAVTPPNAAAGARPRYSLVLKLVLHPPAGESVRMVDPAWGVPTAVGSAAAAR